MSTNREPRAITSPLTGLSAVSGTFGWGIYDENGVEIDNGLSEDEARERVTLEEG